MQCIFPFKICLDMSSKALFSNWLLYKLVILITAIGVTISDCLDYTIIMAKIIHNNVIIEIAIENFQRKFKKVLLSVIFDWIHKNFFCVR